MTYGFLLALIGVVASQVPTAAQQSGVTFANTPGQIFVPLRATAEAIGSTVNWDPVSGVDIDGRPLSSEGIRTLYDGTKLVPVRTFASSDVAVDYDAATEEVRLSRGDLALVVVPGAKHVEVSIGKQTLKAWQGDILVMDTNISSGRRGFATPRGRFQAGSRERMHYSRLYNNSPMPFAVQINGHVFIHGYSSVPRRPASHGCIRMPLHGKNAAKYFYEWVDIGTSVNVFDDFERAT